MSISNQEKVAVLGLGYVGLPVALAMAGKFPTVGFDINEKRISELKAGHDETGEVSKEELKAMKTISFSMDTDDLKDCTFFIVAVPTPIDNDNRPDLTPMVSASKTVAKALSKGDVVVYESTVYPGVTEEICGPLLEKLTGLKSGVDFFLGYSPERINPGDKEHTFTKITKVVSGQDEATLERVANVYASVVTAGVHKAPTIKVAEAAKVIENTQRDLNIALMNELALIFDRMDIRTKDVLEAAGTKWNFLKFFPGLVGGHCIGVDPYYLTTKAESLGYQPQVILSGRRINNGMGAFVAQKTTKFLSTAGINLAEAKVGVLGLTFKENVPDLRNSRVPDIVHELRAFGISPMVHDIMADKDEAQHEYNIELCEWDAVSHLDALILAVTHDGYMEEGPGFLTSRIKENGFFIDVKSAISPKDVPSNISYWSL